MKSITELMKPINDCTTGPILREALLKLRKNSSSFKWLLYNEESLELSCLEHTIPEVTSELELTDMDADDVTTYASYLNTELYDVPEYPRGFTKLVALFNDEYVTLYHHDTFENCFLVDVNLCQKIIAA